MKSFINKLISKGDEVSSKRVLSLFFALVLTGVVITHLCGVVVSEAIIWALVALISSGVGMSSIEKFKK